MVAMKRNLWHLGTLEDNGAASDSALVSKLSLLNLIGIVPVMVGLTAAAVVAFVVELLWDRNRSVQLT